MKKLIGSNVSCEITLKGRYISAEHAELIEQNNKVYLLDLNSQFGTFVNGKRIESQTELVKGDRVKIGTQLFHWKDCLASSSSTVNKYPIYFKDLFATTGLIDWNNYRVISLVFIGFLIITPLAVPSLLNILPYVFHGRTQERIEELNLPQNSDILTIVLCFVFIYIILNLTQKFIRFKLKNRP